jgi:hypothetical protein
MTVFALLGAKALWLTYIWLASTIVSAWLSDRKGYGEKPGLASGLLLTAIGVVIWLIVPAREDSRWKVQGAIPRRGAQTVAEARAQRHEQDPGES